MRYPLIVRQYLLLLALQFAYILEQIWGYSIFVSVVDSMGRFLAISWVFGTIPMVFLYFILQKRIWAFQMGSVYTIAMVLLGLLHITGYLVTHRYFYGFAGLISGFGLIITGIPLLISLRREIPALPH